jgi:predicted DNA-binding transcriptional regulator AlpA
MHVAEVVIVPRGLSRSQAAAYVGIGTTLFDRLVTAGKMPHPREIGGRRIWDRHEVDMAFDDLPRLGEAEDASNPWDTRLGTSSRAEDAQAGTTTSPPHIPNAYSPASLAKRWACSERLVRNLVQKGELAPMLLGGKLLRITRDVVEAYEMKNHGAKPRHPRKGGD